MSFDLTTEYPRWRLAPGRRANPSLASTSPVSASFDLEDADVAALSDHLPVPPPVRHIRQIRCRCLRTNTRAFELRYGAAQVGLTSFPGVLPVLGDRGPRRARCNCTEERSKQLEAVLAGCW